MSKCIKIKEELESRYPNLYIDMDDSERDYLLNQRMYVRQLNGGPGQNIYMDNIMFTTFNIKKILNSKTVPKNLSTLDNTLKEIDVEAEKSREKNKFFCTVCRKCKDIKKEYKGNIMNTVFCTECHDADKNLADTFKESQKSGYYD